MRISLARAQPVNVRFDANIRAIVRDTEDGGDPGEARGEGEVVEGALLRYEVPVLQGREEDAWVDGRDVAYVRVWVTISGSREHNILRGMERT